MPQQNRFASALKTAPNKEYPVKKEESVAANSSNSINRPSAPASSVMGARPTSADSCNTITLYLMKFNTVSTIISFRTS